jgi:CheY-like chemotaxis protein
LLVVKSADIPFPSLPLADRAKVILCIDDDPAILRYQRAVLERNGYAVVTVASSREGLGLALRGGFDAVIVDYKMPGLDGHQVASEIRRARPDIPVIMFSGSDVPAAVLDVVSAFVPKLSVDRFLPVVASFVSPITPQVEFCNLPG